MVELSMNWKGFGRKGFMAQLRYCSGICLEGLRRIKKYLRMTDIRTEIQTDYRPTRSSERYLYAMLLLQARKLKYVMWEQPPVV
jgi:hypothetical protein